MLHELLSHSADKNRIDDFFMSNDYLIDVPHGEFLSKNSNEK